ncbi:methylenetetrahydrofolate reductase C-terminal domain-containing protein [Herbiconiux sp. KACC 21604]|uniref:methylenetetrahydrofolate reductase C-terminal domain-containing protein n=1 Tax=unclassified Herbiconiux TaxID=2618217 RepID=UPI001491749A|nr:methylenetetrahydrofolate reductase C-terminal domain-containing protein [Herbiconiux sp. SALV-R1]QJU54035.1 methylenetetrahydrofolate reductase [Herbiconiux sp. SALV-R1]WPO85071.1 methylenetetrahydrofolate reductase C-terminal domain-containing protein [Herbiconiux sp. KACC 21604]
MSVTTELREACPKHMEYGPCGGVDFDGSCEVGAFRCVFLDLPTVRWKGGGEGPDENSPTAPRHGASAMRDLLATRQVVVADFPGRALDRASLEECVDALAGRVDAVLAGDSGRSRVQFSPAYRAHLIQQRGLPVWTGLNCRDRNRVALEGELAGLAEVGVAAVHCVTGDHTLTGDRPDAKPVFDLDSTRVAALARRAGHLVSVGESPTTPPHDRRAARLAEKVRAGAEICFVNHAGGAEPVRRFIAESRDAGAAPGFIACVPMVVDHGSAALLRSFTTLVLPEGFLDGILASSDPRRAGIDAALVLSERLLELDGVVGVNLSGGAADGHEREFAEALAEVADRLQLGAPGASAASPKLTP